MKAILNKIPACNIRGIRGPLPSMRIVDMKGYGDFKMRFVHLKI